MMIIWRYHTNAARRFNKKEKKNWIRKDERKWILYYELAKLLLYLSNASPPAGVHQVDASPYDAFVKRREISARWNEEGRQEELESGIKTKVGRHLKKSWWKEKENATVWEWERTKWRLRVRRKREKTRRFPQKVFTIDNCSLKNGMLVFSVFSFSF